MSASSTTLENRPQAPRRRRSEPRTALRSAQEYMRGIVGGLLFSLPTLYTMEVWWSGLLFNEVRLLSMLAFTMVLLLLYNSHAGIHPQQNFGNVLLESIEELGIGLVLSATILYLLGRIQPQDPFGEVLGKIVIEAMLVAIGVSVGTAQLGNPDDHPDPAESTEPHSLSLVGRASLALCGTVLVAGNVAPTDEIVVLGSQSSPASLLALVALSLILTAIVLFFSEFKGGSSGSDAEPLPVSQYGLGICLAYSVALLASYLLLWLFGRFDTKGFQECLDLVVILALPGSLGASAGSLLIR